MQCKKDGEPIHLLQVPSKGARDTSQIPARYENSITCIHVIEFGAGGNSQMKWYPYGHDFGNAKIGGGTVLVGGNTCSFTIPTPSSKSHTPTIRNFCFKLHPSNTPFIPS